MKDEEKKVSSMEQFKIAKHHSTPKRMSLLSPSGELTDEWIEVIGIESHKMRGRKNELYREIAESTKEGTKFTGEVQDQFNKKLLATAVTGWSFEEECNEENVIQFFTDAPQIQEAVDAFCVDNGNYFEKK